MTRGRRVLAAGALAAVVALGLAMPAHANQAPTVKNPLALNPAPTSSGVITSSDPVTAFGTFEMPNGVVDSIFLTVTSLANPPLFQPQTVDACPQSGCGKKTVSYAKALPGLSYNGPYSVQAKAAGTESPTDTDGQQTSVSPADPLQFKVAAPPAVPKDVVVAKGDNRAVTVSWTRNSEPDMVRYVVWRKGPADKGYFNIGSVQQPTANSVPVTFKDTTVPSTGGDYSYSIVAERNSGDPGIRNPYAVSTVSTIKLDGPPATTTTTAKPGSTGTTAPPFTVPTPGTTPAAQSHSSPLPSPFIFRSNNGGVDLSRVGAGSGGDGPFNQELPYGVTPTTGKALKGSSPQALQVNSTGKGGPGAKAVLIPMAAGAALLLVALQLRWLSGRATEPDLAEPGDYA